jgi:hypothetical protein
MFQDMKDPLGDVQKTEASSSRYVCVHMVVEASETHSTALRSVFVLMKVR